MGESVGQGPTDVPGEPGALLTAARAGDEAAMGALLSMHQDQIYRFAMRMCRNSADAEDVLQDTLLSAVRNLPTFRGDSKLSTWLFAIARSFCIKKHNKNARADAIAEASAEHRQGDSVLPEQQAGDRELLDALEDAMHLLDDDSRAVLLLRDVEGLSAKETAAALDMSVPQVKSRLHRARAQLRAHIRQPLDRLKPIEGESKPGCPDIVDTFSHYLEDDIGPEMCVQMQNHVEGCEFCNSTCESLKHTIAVCNAVPAPEVPRAVQVRLRHAIRRHMQGQ